MSRRFFSGRECWVYRAQSLIELCGHHPDLIGGALAGTAPDYLLYSPLRETNRGPFGLEGPCGSHALAVTQSSLLISRDPHRADEPRTVREIPFRSVLTIALGEALTLGWLVVRFAAERQLASEIVFFQSSGIAHFRELVRTWIRRLSPVSSHRRPSENWRGALADSPAYLTSQVGPLLDEEDDVLVVNAPEAWSAARGTRTCLSPATLIAATDRTVTIAENERPCRPDMLVFGVNVTCIPRERVTSTTLQMPDCQEIQTAALSLRLGTDVVHDVNSHLTIPADVARSLLSHVSPDRAPKTSVAC
jgi:hypothetical protein